MGLLGNATEIECRMYWRLAAELRSAATQGEDLADMLDELDVLGEFTDSEALRDRCMAMIAQYAEGAVEPRKVLL